MSRGHLMLIMMRMMMVQMVVARVLLGLFEGGGGRHGIVIAGAVIRMVEALAELVAAFLVRGPFSFVPVILEPELVRVCACLCVCSIG